MDHTKPYVRHCCNCGGPINPHFFTQVNAKFWCEKPACTELGDAVVKAAVSKPVNAK